MQWLAQTYPDKADITNVKMAIDAGAIGAFVMENCRQAGFWKRWIILPNQLNISGPGLNCRNCRPCNPGTNDLYREWYRMRFFMKTFHHDKYWSAIPVKTGASLCITSKAAVLTVPRIMIIYGALRQRRYLNFFKTCKTPWIAYKVLAAGAIKQKMELNLHLKTAQTLYASECWFSDNPNANIVYNTINSDLKRERAWYGFSTIKIFKKVKNKSFRFSLLIYWVWLFSIDNRMPARWRTEAGEGFINVIGGKVWYRVVGKAINHQFTFARRTGRNQLYTNPLSALGKDRPVIFLDSIGSGRSDRITDTTLMTVETMSNRLNRSGKLLD